MFIIATWVTVTDQVMAATQRAVYKEMGLYIVLIVAFAIVLSRAEMFASRNKLLPSIRRRRSHGIGLSAGPRAARRVPGVPGQGVALGRPDPAWQSRCSS